MFPGQRNHTHEVKRKRKIALAFISEFHLHSTTHLIPGDDDGDVVYHEQEE